MARLATLLWAVPPTLAALMLAKAGLQPRHDAAPAARLAGPPTIERLAPPGRLHVPSDARPVISTALPLASPLTSASPQRTTGDANRSAEETATMKAGPARRWTAISPGQAASKAESQAESREILYPIAENRALPKLADAWPDGADAAEAAEPLPALRPPQSEGALPAATPLAAASSSGTQALAAVHRQVNAANQKAVKLALRGALYSARAELLAALRLLAQAQDARGGTTHRTAALAAALTAMEESEDFTQSAGAPPAALPDILRPHRTPALKTIDVTRLSHLTCSQHYFAYAQQQLNVAAGGDPAAAQTLYLLGKVHGQLAGETANVHSAHTARAMVFHQATLAIDPRHYQAANELGVLLARFGELSAARQMLLASVTSRPTVSAWHNLASVHERLGENDLAGKARYEAKLLAGRAPAGSSGQSVQWVDAATFAAQSPAAGIEPLRGKSVRAAASGSIQAGAAPLRR